MPGAGRAHRLRERARNRGRNAPHVAEAAAYAAEHATDLRAIELDVASQESADAAVSAIIAEHGRIDVIAHNAGHMADLANSLLLLVPVLVPAAALCVAGVVLVSRPVTTRSVSAAEAEAQPVTPPIPDRS